MSTVRVGSNLVIALPASILDRAGVAENDILEADCVDGVITLTPKPHAVKQDDLMAYAGVAARVFGQAERIDEYIGGLRDEWER